MKCAMSDAATEPLPAGPRLHDFEGLGRLGRNRMAFGHQRGGHIRHRGRLNLKELLLHAM
jgi:hypothetical protein